MGKSAFAAFGGARRVSDVGWRRLAEDEEFYEEEYQECHRELAQEEALREREAGGLWYWCRRRHIWRG